MRAYRMVVICRDFEGYGHEEFVTMIEQHDHTHATVERVESADIGEWTDAHPLNQRERDASQYSWALEYSVAVPVGSDPPGSGRSTSPLVPNAPGIIRLTTWATYADFSDLRPIYIPAAALLSWVGQKSRGRTADPDGNRGEDWRDVSVLTLGMLGTIKEEVFVMEPAEEVARLYAEAMARVSVSNGVARVAAGSGGPTREQISAWAASVGNGGRTES